MGNLEGLFGAAVVACEVEEKHLLLAAISTARALLKSSMADRIRVLN